MPATAFTHKIISCHQQLGPGSSSHPITFCLWQPQHPTNRIRGTPAIQTIHQHLQFASFEYCAYHSTTHNPFPARVPLGSCLSFCLCICQSLLEDCTSTQWQWRNSIEVSRQQVFLVTLDGLPLAEYLKLLFTLQAASPVPMTSAEGRDWPPKPPMSNIVQLKQLW